MVLGAERHLGREVCQRIYVLDVERHQATGRAEEHNTVVERHEVVSWAEEYKLVFIMLCFCACQGVLSQLLFLSQLLCMSRAPQFPQFYFPRVLIWLLQCVVQSCSIENFRLMSYVEMPLIWQILCYRLMAKVELC